MAPYASQLEYIRQRALLESDLTLAENLTTFYAAYAGVVTQTCKKYRLDSTEVQQYEAEKRFFKIILGPKEFFPFQPPYRKYILQLRLIQQKAFDAGISPEAFEQVCKRLARERYEDEEEDFDLKQYRTEKLLWGHFWPNDVFPGVDPSVSLPLSPPTNPTRNIAMDVGPRVSTAMVPSQEITPASSQPTPINAKASSGQPIPIAAPPRQEQHISTSSSSGSIHPEEPPFHAAPNTFLHSILHNGSLPAPISSVLRCTVRTEVNWFKGGLNVWIRCGDEGVAVRERARVLVGGWAEMSVDEGWAQMVRVLSDSGGSSRVEGGKRRRVGE